MVFFSHIWLYRSWFSIFNKIFEPKLDTLTPLEKVVYILHSLIHTLAKLKHKLATFAIPRIRTLDSSSAYTIAKRKPSLIVQGSSILLNLFQLVLITLSHSMHELSSFCLCSNGSVLYLLNPYHSHLLQYPLPSTEGELCTMISLTLKMWMSFYPYCLNIPYVKISSSQIFYECLCLKFYGGH